MTDRKTVIVTGAGSGIGEATAKRFARDGFNVVLNGRTQEKLDEVARDIGGDHVSVIAGDVSNPEDVDALVTGTVTTFGQIKQCLNKCILLLFLCFQAQTTQYHNANQPKTDERFIK